MIKALEKFVKPFYVRKDIMHDLSHIKRILKEAKFLAQKYNADMAILTYGSFFHGFVCTNEKTIIEFLSKQKLPKAKISLILKAAKESQKEQKPQTLEGKILHDAHLIEGGKTFMVVKALITGSLRGQTLKDTLDYLANKTIGKYKCYLPEAQKLYKEKERYAKNFLKEIKKNV